MLPLLTNLYAYLLPAFSPPIDYCRNYRLPDHPIIRTSFYTENPQLSFLAAQKRLYRSVLQECLDFFAKSTISRLFSLPSRCSASVSDRRYRSPLWQGIFIAHPIPLSAMLRFLKRFLSFSGSRPIIAILHGHFSKSQRYTFTISDSVELRKGVNFLKTLKL